MEARLFSPSLSSDGEERAKCLCALHFDNGEMDAGPGRTTQPAKAAPDELVSVVARCPTGALQAIFDDGRDAASVPARNELRVVADGPHHLRGDIEIRDDSGKALARETRMALCRCGASKNKPYCDGSHKAVGFRS